MYGLAHLFVLLAVTFLLAGTLKRPHRPSRYLALLFLAAAFLSHNITFLILPPLAGLLAIFSLFYDRQWLRQPRLWSEAILLLLILALTLTVVALGQVGSTNPLQTIDANAPAPLGLEFLRGFFWPGLEWSRFDNLVGFFETSAYAPMRWAVMIGLIVTLFHVWRRRTTFADVAFLFLTLFVALIVLVMGGLLHDSWSKSRYVYILALPAFLLLSAAGLAYLLRWPVDLLLRLNQDYFRPSWAETSARLFGVVLIVALWGPPAWHVAKMQGTGDYHTAFAFVHQNLQPEDKVMTVHPAAAYLYLGQCDYYANQRTALVLTGDEESDSPVDRYVGSPLVDSVETLNAVLSAGPRVWFVVDQVRLYERFEPLFSQQVLAQMDLIRQTGPVNVFVSRPHPIPLPAEPPVSLDANFSHIIHLKGYSLDTEAIAPDGTIPLGLYWRPVGEPTRQMKVFTQLRDAQGQIISQADHFAWEGLLTLAEWNKLKQSGEWLRDTAHLRLPSPLPAENAPYWIYVGLYDPVTLERVPLLNDASGENAVIIPVPKLP
jgi:hypothetical protein